MEIRSTHGRRTFFLRFYNKQGSQKGKGKRRRFPSLFIAAGEFISEHAA